MESIIDRIIIFICCTVFMIGFGIDTYTIVPIIISIIINCCIIFFNTPSVSISGFLVYIMLFFAFPKLLFFLPLFLYSIFMESYVYIGIISIIPMIYNYNTMSYVSYFLIFILCIFSYIIKRRTFELRELKQNYISLRDNMREEQDRLQIKNKDLLEKQEYEIYNATLSERNRIAREIHDTVGHIISRSLLQIGALIAISNDGPVKDGLSSVRNTLSTGMDSIRNNIHNLHEDSMNLDNELKKLVDDFTFCEIDYQFSIISNMNMKINYAILYIVREALSNVIKHSNATKVTILITEIPSFYQILIHDNGSIHPHIKSLSGSEMGISGFYERVASLNGNINISSDNGFKIYITIPKGVQND